MYKWKTLVVWILVFFPPIFGTTPATSESGMVTMKKGVVTSKPQYPAFPAIADNLRNDMKKLQTSLDRTADGLEKLEPHWLHSREKPKEIFGKIDNLRDSVDSIDVKFLSENLERISRTQNRNSRLINVQMDYLTNLEESFDRLEKLLFRKMVSNNATKSFYEPAFTVYQRQVVDRLTSIDNKLDGKLPDRRGVSPTKIHEDDDFRGNSINGTSTGKRNSDEDETNLSSPNHPKTIRIVIPNCEALRGTGLVSGAYTVDKSMEFIWGNSSAVFCDTTTDGGGWTVIQKRGSSRGEPINFTRSWKDYADGFGNLLGEFWLGNEIVHRMTFYNGPHELRIDLEDWDGVTVWAQYSNFLLGSKRDNYRIKVSGYIGNATDSLSAHDSTPFSTFDRRNDLAPRCCPCTSDYGGGWWYYSCFEANLNGDYYEKDQRRLPFRGIIWEHWHGNYSLKSTRMMIRSRKSDAKTRIEHDYRDSGIAESGP